MQKGLAVKDQPIVSRKRKPAHTIRFENFYPSSSSFPLLIPQIPKHNQIATYHRKKAAHNPKSHLVVENHAAGDRCAVNPELEGVLSWTHALRFRPSPTRIVNRFSTISLTSFARNCCVPAFEVFLKQQNRPHSLVSETGE